MDVSYLPASEDEVTYSSSGFDETEQDSTSIGFKTTLDFGTGLNMRLSSIGDLPDSIQQQSSINFTTQKLEALRLAESPCRFTQRIIVKVRTEAKEHETPQLSYGTHGWARIPHGIPNAEAEIVRKSFLNESPSKNYGNKKVTPTPVRRIRIKRTYRELPPPLTLTRDRRPRGLFSPRSAFRTGLIGRRILFGKGYENEEFSFDSGDKRDVYVDNNFTETEELDQTLPWESPNQNESFQTESSKSSPRHIEKQYTGSSESGSPLSSIEGSEELDWDGLFSPDIEDSPIRQRFSEPTRKMHGFDKVHLSQPSTGFIPRTL